MTRENRLFVLKSKKKEKVLDKGQNVFFYVKTTTTTTNVLIFFPLDWGMLRRSRHVLIFSLNNIFFQYHGYIYNNL